MMLSCKQMAEKLTATARKAENTLVVPTEELLGELQIMAKGFIGYYQDGWAPLAPRTVEDKEKKGYAPPDNPLLRTGEMHDSITFEVEMPRFGIVEGILGSESKVALEQEMGVVRTKGTLPPRPFLALAMARSYVPAERLYGQFALKLLEL